ncbi:MAG TPA: hypothetical protein VF773_07465 [Verrucomicrobiae bacterium]
MKREPTNKLPIVALICVAVLLLSGWLFFLATDELAGINYRRKTNNSNSQKTNSDSELQTNRSSHPR